MQANTDFKKESGNLAQVKRRPALMLPVLLVITVLCFIYPDKAGYIAAAGLVIYAIFYTAWVLFCRTRLMSEVVNFAEQYNAVQRHQLENMPLAYALVDMEGRFIWKNRAFKEMGGVEVSHLYMINRELAENLPVGDEFRKLRVTMGGNVYDAEMSYVENAADSAIALHMTDVTGYVKAMEEIEAMKPVVGRVYIDNYDELMSSTETVRRAVLEAVIDRKLNKYFSAHDGVVNKIENDKFVLFLSKAGLEQLQENRFSVVDEIRSINIGNTVAPTVSIGIGVDGASLSENERYARVAMDLCLGRGGDQAIVRTADGPIYYGGKTQGTEKNTRVKARVKAEALKELLQSKERVLVMGHQMTDIDSLGAAVGIFRIAKVLGKKASIVIDDPISSIRPVIDSFAGPEYAEDFIVDGDRAKLLCDEDTVVAVVDVNRPSYCECPELLEAAKNVVVLDHHRQGIETIPNAILSYIEPYASSASEMVAEVLQYIGDDVKLPVVEAEAMYAGIVIDTNNFMNKTGVRTFEAAAYLRRHGADMARVRKMFRGHMEEYKAKAEAIRSAEIFMDAYAFAECPSEGLDSPTIVGAQAANDLLDIVGIKASIVFTKYEDKVYLSARSIDEVNVQLIMERLGGGGHLSIAGAQMKGCSVEEAMELAKETIAQMVEEGAI